MKNKALLFAATLLITHAAWATTPENGWWWDPAEPGWGFNIETQKGIVFVAAFVYDEGGSPIWYSGSGKLEDNTVTATLLRFNGGQCLGCPYQAPTTGKGPGPITITFTSPGAATVTWAGNSIPIERFNFNLAAGIQRLLGEWVFIPEKPSDIDSYRGDRITFNHLTKEGLLIGSRTGLLSKEAIARETNTHKKFEYLIMIEESPFSTEVLAFNFKGLNKIEGIGALVSSSATQDEIWHTLNSSNLSFEAYRAH